MAEKGYGKRPLWQWFLVYAVIGAIVYGLIYYFVIANKGAGSNAGKTTETSQPSLY